MTAALLMMIAGCDRQTHRYATLAEAQEAQMIDKGWLPPNLPPSTHDIEVMTDLDAAEGSGRFEMSAADMERFLADLSPLGRFEADGSYWYFRCDRRQNACEFDVR